MKLNGFELTIPQGIETVDGHIDMKHNTRYTINLHNNKDVDCDALVSVDGKEQGEFRILKHGQIVLERPAHDTGHFTCYKLDTPEGASAQLVAGDNLGLITVTFKPAHACKVHKVYSPSFNADFLYNPTRGAAGTGLSGKSAQKFSSVLALDYDETQVTTIHLRLVVTDDDKPRPLTSASPLRETVIPSSV